MPPDLAADFDAALIEFACCLDNVLCVHGNYVSTDTTLVNASFLRIDKESAAREKTDGASAQAE